jgi:hypothetical protein
MTAIRSPDEIILKDLLTMTGTSTPLWNRSNNLLFEVEKVDLCSVSDLSRKSDVRWC